MDIQVTNSKFSQISDALGLEELSPEEQEEILLDLNALVFKGSLVRLIERMDASARDDFAVLMDRNADEEEVDTFLKERVPNADQAVLDTVEELTNDILAVATA